ncbi:hypothetical protein TcCL_NonESM05902, partial [Trypanosoma cruzi]
AGKKAVMCRTRFEEQRASLRPLSDRRHEEVPEEGCPWHEQAHHPAPLSRGRVPACRESQTLSADAVQHGLVEGAPRPHQRLGCVEEGQVEAAGEEVVPGSLQRRQQPLVLPASALLGCCLCMIPL